MSTTLKPPKPATLADLADKLFPHSPIEVFKDSTIIAGEKVDEYHIYVEGQWFSKLPQDQFKHLVNDINNIIKLQGDDWYYPSTRVDPTWIGWERISQIDLAEFRCWRGE